ncbi:MAG: DUF3298 domain-containing protein [Bacteroidales bacterium]|nr:DUF3298 domain-containing protein [Bacteroidales bacterium]
MRTGTIYLTIFLFISFYSLAQRKQETASFMHLTGTIGSELELTMNLVKVGDTLFGTASYHVADATKNVRYHNIDGSVRQVYGKVDAKGKFRIREWGNDRGPVLSGTLANNNQMSGVWINAGLHSTKMNFRLAESYPAGTMNFKVLTLNEKRPILKEKSEPSAHLRLTVVIPDRRLNPAVPGSVTDTILSLFQEGQTEEKDPQQLVNTIKDAFFNEYFQTNEPLLNEQSGPSLNWELIKSGFVLYNELHVLSYMVMTYEFTGGAHGLETSLYKTFDLKNGKIISVRDLFFPGSEGKLTGILTAKLRQTTGLKETVKLTDRGYFTDLIKPSENFYLSSQGIGFVYNPYEIAPHSFGTITIFVSNAELSEILKPR